MGNKPEKSRFDQTVLDKLIEETGLEREVIIAWRLVKINLLDFFVVIFIIENNS
jgi:hypothetical protein